MTRPIRNTVSREKILRQPSGQAGHRQDADREREAAEHLHHAELGANLARRGAALPAASARDTTSVDIASATTSWITVPMHDQHGAEDVEPVRAEEGEPAAGRAGERDHAARGEARADQHIGAAAASRRSARCRPVRRTPS